MYTDCVLNTKHIALKYGSYVPHKTTIKLHCRIRRPLIIRRVYNEYIAIFNTDTNLLHLGSIATIKF